jgi:translation initiation factor IF-1
MICGLGVAADVNAKLSAVSCDNEFARLRRMRDKLAENIKVRKGFVIFCVVCPTLWYWT